MTLPKFGPIEYATPWVLEDALQLARKIEEIAPAYGYHVALTGGLLYKDGARKDCDLVMYRDGNNKYDLQSLMAHLGTIVNFAVQPNIINRVHKGTWDGKPVDIFLSENDGPYARDEQTEVSITSIPTELIPL